MREYTIDRRTALLYSGAALTGLSGCLGGTAGSDGPDNSTGDEAGDDHAEDDGHDDGDTHDETGEAGHDDAEEGGHHEHEHDHQEAHEHVLGEPEDAITVRMVTNDAGQHFLPHVVHVTPGATVTWELGDGGHDTVAYHPDNDRPQRVPDDVEPWDSPLLAESGATFERTFDVEGVYDYYCTPHESLGMVGRVVVGEPDLHDEPAMAAPPDAIPSGAREIIAEFNTRVEDALGHH